jgi:hypothetical protein
MICVSRLQAQAKHFFKVPTGVPDPLACELK